MSEPVRALLAFPSITLDPVFFDNGKLWKARYPSLIDHGHAPQKLQLEPAFQVFADSLEVIFRIGAGQNAVFEDLGEAVRFDRLTPAVPGQPVAGIAVTLVDGDPRACRVVWTRNPGARLTVLRIVCRHEAGGPAEEADGAARTQVEGGVYLAILDGGEARAFDGPRRTSNRPRRPGRVQVVDINPANSRPVYDLFRAQFSDLEAVAPEPAFRVSHGDSIDFPLALDLPPDYHGVRFKADGAGQVEMSYAVPAMRPEHLTGSPAGEDGLLCTVQWHHPACVGLCTQGRTANLYAQVDPGPLRGTPLGDALANVSVDPTVIEPPACDAGGVCTRPRDREGEGS
jgi:hypothetical protein